jgi:uncharacterized membrane protein
MGGCAKWLFWMVMAAIVTVFALLGEYRTWAAVMFIVALGLTIAYQVAETEEW